MESGIIYIVVCHLKDETGCYWEETCQSWMWHRAPGPCNEVAESWRLIKHETISISVISLQSFSFRFLIQFWGDNDDFTTFCLKIWSIVKMTNCTTFSLVWTDLAWLWPGVDDDWRRMRGWCQVLRLWLRYHGDVFSGGGVGAGARQWNNYHTKGNIEWIMTTIT